MRDFLGGGEADLGGGEPQNFFRASREIFFRATRETNLGLRPPLNQFRPPLKNLQEISPPPRKNPDYALATHGCSLINVGPKLNNSYFLLVCLTCVGRNARRGAPSPKFVSRVARKKISREARKKIWGSPPPLNQLRPILKIAQSASDLSESRIRVRIRIFSKSGSGGDILKRL